MGLISIEHQPLAYWADAAWYGAVVIGLAVALGVGMPAVPGWTDWWPLLALPPLGLLLWTLAEYLPHRFVLHGIAPFSQRHALHHHGGAPAAYGVTTGLWDQVFVSAPTRGPRRPTTQTSPAAAHWGRPTGPDNQRKSA